MLIDLSLDEIRLLAQALVSNTTIADYSDYNKDFDYKASALKDLELCQRLETYLPPDDPRSDGYWSHYV